nr:unnamed protein product [Callosobruchus chinensis]
MDLGLVFLRRLVWLSTFNTLTMN